MTDREVDREPRTSWRIRHSHEVTGISRRAYDRWLRRYERRSSREPRRTVRAAMAFVIVGSHGQPVPAGYWRLASPA